MSKKAVAKEESVRILLAEGASRHSRGTILLVDDEEIMIEVGKEILETTGYQVRTAGNGEEAIDWYKRERDRIQLVVLDMIMPGLDAATTVQQLQEINPTIKVMLVSGYGFNSEVKQIMAHGALSFLQKPFRINQLLEKVNDVLAAGRS